MSAFLFFRLGVTAVMPALLCGLAAPFVQAPEYVRIDRWLRRIFLATFGVAALCFVTCFLIVIWSTP